MAAPASGFFARVKDTFPVFASAVTLVAAGGAAALYSSNTRSEVRLLQTDMEKQVAIYAGKLDVERERNSALEARIGEKVQQARADTARDFLQLGFTEEFQNYQRKLKLNTREYGDGDGKETVG